MSVGTSFILFIWQVDKELSFLFRNGLLRGSVLSMTT